MKKIRKAHLIFGGAILSVVAASAIVFLIPYFKAEEQQDFEEELIGQYLENPEGIPVSLPKEPLDLDDVGSVDENNAGTTDTGVPQGPTGYNFSDIDTKEFIGEIDSILVIDKIDMKKVIIRGPENTYNLDRYYFVTADTSTPLNGGNYIIYGHCSRTYGHSFNRLDELEIGDSFYLIQNGQEYAYKIEEKNKVLRSECSSFFPEKTCVTLVSCEKDLQPGFTEKRVIIIRAVPV